MAKKKDTRTCKTLNTASIIRGELYFEDARQCTLQDDILTDMLEDPHIKAIRLVSLSSDWHLRVHLPGAVIVEKINFEMTLRKEHFGQRDHWYAYRRVVGRLHKRYVGDSSRITEERLLQIAQVLPG